MKLLPVVVLLLVIPSTLYAIDAEKVKPCNVAYRCSSEVNTVWATDGKSCRVFRNGCLLTSENCSRQNRSETALKEIEKEKCQSLCSRICPDNYSPVCGYYNDEKRTFANQCEMDSHICTTGETFGLFREEPCE